MTMTPIHLEHNGHGIGITGVVIAAHVAGMFLPSPFSGWLVDRFGYLPIAAGAGVIMLAAGLLAAWAPVDSVGTLLLALVLLGLGWNLGLVSGTTLVTDAAPLETRARTQGVVDLGVALAGAGAGLSSGLIVTAASYATLTLAGGVLALLIVPVAAIARRSRVEAAAIRYPSMDSPHSGACVQAVRVESEEVPSRVSRARIELCGR
jgi:MFS family permease